MFLRRLAFLCIVMMGLAPAEPIAQAPRATAETPARVDPSVGRLLAAIRSADKGQLAVSEEDGRFLRVLVSATNARSVLEIGAASGYSAIWIGLGLRQTGGRLVTIEYDPVRAKEAAANIQKAGLSDIVQVIAGDAFKEIPKVAGDFDLVFPRVKPGGLFLAHNVINKKSEMPDFLTAIETHPQALTTTVSPGHEGISMTVKTRADR